MGEDGLTVQVQLPGAPCITIVLPVLNLEVVYHEIIGDCPISII
jgi:hypothetical protein